MSSIGIVCGRQYRNKAGEVRKVVRIATYEALGLAGMPTRKRIFYRVNGGEVKTGRLDKFIRWAREGEAVVVESEASK